MKSINNALIILACIFTFLFGLISLVTPGVSKLSISIDPQTRPNNMENKIYVDDHFYININLVGGKRSYKKNVRLKSSDESIATIKYDDVKGEAWFEAKAVGTVTITAEYRQSVIFKNYFKKTIEINIEPRPVASVMLSNDYKTIKLGETLTISSTVLPNNATNKTLTFTSSNPSVISVDQSGNITALSLGTSKITATADNGVSDFIEIEVKEEILPESITLNKTIITGSINANYYLSCDFLPLNTSVKTLTWTSSNLDVATVSSDGVVTFEGVGNATITATTSNGKTATCSIYVPQVSAQLFYLKGENNETIGVLNNLAVGDTYQLKYICMPSNVTDKVEWRSSKNEVATVSNNGLVTIHSKGNVIIYATLSGIERNILITVQ